MLLRSAHQYFASNQDPLRENRLLAFADENLVEQETEQQSAESADSAAADVADGTRSKAADVMSGAESGDESEEVAVQRKETYSGAETARNVEAAMDKLRTSLNIYYSLQKKVMILPKEERGKHLYAINEHRKPLENLYTELTEYQEFANKVRDFEMGRVHPAKFRNWIRKKYLEDAKGQEELREGDDSNDPDAGNPSKNQNAWNNLKNIQDKDAANEQLYLSAFDEKFKKLDEYIHWDDSVQGSKELSANQLIEKLPDVQHYLNIINSRIGLMDKKFAEINKYAKGLDEYKEKVNESNIGEFLRGQLGTWYSGHQIISAFKSWGESSVKAYEEWNKLKGAELAKRALGPAGRLLPFGKQTETILDRELESSNDEVKESYLNYLKAKNFRFANIKSLLGRNQYDGNRFRAILEYAAEKGWLYDFKTSERRVFGYKLEAGTTLPGTWNEDNITQYIQKIDSDNGSGQETAKDQGYKRVQTLDSITPIIRVLEDELDQQNYWAVHGIVKRAMEKGKEGETSPWLATTIFRHLRTEPEGRKYLPKGLIDDIGNIGIQHPAWTLTYYKTDRHEIHDDWQQQFTGENTNAAAQNSIESAGVLATAINKIEKRIIKTLGYTPNNRELDRYVARVLAAQVIPLKGKNISIYDDEFTSYRQNLEDSATTIDINAADDDFFGLESEVVLLGQEGYNAILECGTNGEFNNSTKAFSFLDQLIEKEEVLAKQKDKQYSNFLEETREKMDDYFNRKFSHGPTQKIWRERKRRNTGEVLMDILEKKGLLSKHVYDRYMLDKNTYTKTYKVDPEKGYKHPKTEE